METNIIQPVQPGEPFHPEDLSGDHPIFEAVEAIRRDELVVFPTETVYGLGANALSPEAVRKIYDVKGRPCDNPLIVHVAAIADILPLTIHHTPAAKQLMNAFMPGPITLVFRKSTAVPREVTAGLETVAVRIPSHPVGRRFVELCQTPIAAPSANLSGRPSPTSLKHVLNDLKGKVGFVIDGGYCEIGLESTVVDVTGDEPVILRPGAVTAEDILTVCRSVRTVSEHRVETPPSPGMKYRHYAPDAAVFPVSFMPDRELSPEMLRRIVDWQSNGMLVGAYCSDEMKSWLISRIPNVFCISFGAGGDIRSAMSKLYYALRKMDERNIDLVMVESFAPTGLGNAYMNRLMKAAGENRMNGDESE